MLTLFKNQPFLWWGIDIVKHIECIFIANKKDFFFLSISMESLSYELDPKTKYLEF